MNKPITKLDAFRDGEHFLKRARKDFKSALESKEASYSLCRHLLDYAAYEASYALMCFCASVFETFGESKALDMHMLRDHLAEVEVVLEAQGIAMPTIEGLGTLDYAILHCDGKCGEIEVFDEGLIRSFIESVANLQKTIEGITT